MRQAILHLEFRTPAAIEHGVDIANEAFRTANKWAQTIWEVAVDTEASDIDIIVDCKDDATILQAGVEFGRILEVCNIVGNAAHNCGIYVGKVGEQV